MIPCTTIIAQQPNTRESLCLSPVTASPSAACTGCHAIPAQIPQGKHLMQRSRDQAVGKSPFDIQGQQRSWKFSLWVLGIAAKKKTSVQPAVISATSDSLLGFCTSTSILISAAQWQKNFDNVSTVRQWSISWEFYFLRDQRRRWRILHGKETISRHHQLAPISCQQRMRIPGASKFWLLV